LSIGFSYALQMLETLVLAVLAGGAAGAGVHFVLTWSLRRSFFELAGLVDDFQDRLTRSDKKRAAEASVASRAAPLLSPGDQAVVDQVTTVRGRRTPWWEHLHGHKSQ